MGAASLVPLLPPFWEKPEEPTIPLPVPAPEPLEPDEPLEPEEPEEPLPELVESPPRTPPPDIPGTVSGVNEGEAEALVEEPLLEGALGLNDGLSPVA